MRARVCSLEFTGTPCIQTRGGPMPKMAENHSEDPDLLLAKGQISHTIPKIFSNNELS